MRIRHYRKVAALGAMALASNAMAFDGDWDGSYGRHADGDGFHDGRDRFSLHEKIELLRKKVKYVFVIFHENESFDHFFGTYPGANGLFEAPKGFTPADQDAELQAALSRHGSERHDDLAVPDAPVGRRRRRKVIPVYPADEISVDHSHQGMANSLDVDPTTGIAANDRYAMDQEGLTTNASGDIVTKTGAAPTSITLAQKQKAETDIGHIDCDTIPFMWSWAKNFVLFDNFHQTIVGPSTPNAIAIIAGQSGETQWALHPDEGATVTYANPLFPNVLGASYSSKITPTNSNAYRSGRGRSRPVPGLEPRHERGQAAVQYDENAANPTLNLTFATQPLSFMGFDIEKIIKSDPNPAADLRDVQQDIRKIASFDRPVKLGLVSAGLQRQRHAGSL